MEIDQNVAEVVVEVEEDGADAKRYNNVDYEAEPVVTEVPAHVDERAACEG